ncbi:hypothetical protein OF83DRAFT_1111317 [Amylostereum chailletii]|nr:hypothetical protein OF83DRAFT_1111317 [Amylostereum chailletii]
MSTEEPERVAQHEPSKDGDAPMDEPQAPPAPNAIDVKKRPRLDLNVGKERKRGKSMFGLVLGTLNKAKNEDKARNASEAARKRQEIDQRLQNKLRKETDTVRRAEEAKKDKYTAMRKEEELQLKDSIHKLRRTRLPLLANFLVTSDDIPTDDTRTSSRQPLSHPPRSHPPPLFYLPATLTPAQESFLAKRKVEVKEAAEKEWEAFHIERAEGIEELTSLRKRVAEEEARKKVEQEATKTQEASEEPKASAEPPVEAIRDAAMDVDESPPTEQQENKDKPRPVEKDESTPMQADDDDAVEY